VYLNASKCKIITFTRKCLSLLDKYFLNGIEWELVNIVKRLGVHLESFLASKGHYVHIQNRSSLIIAFIMRSCNYFDNPLAVKSLYSAFIRSIFDYSPIILSLYTSGPIHCLEVIQNHFLWLISIKLTIQRLPHSSFKPLLLYLNLNTLKVRRVKPDNCFIY